MILTSYSSRFLNGKSSEVDLTKIIDGAEILVSTSKSNGILIQIICKNPEMIALNLPKWVHDEFYLFCAYGQLMIRSEQPKHISLVS